MSKRVLGILGSPLKEGNTADLLEAALAGAKSSGAETERLNLIDMKIHPCIECRGCDVGAACVQDDDDMGVIYTKVREVDAVVLASPVFFMGVTAQTKAMIDRFQPFWIEKYVMKRRRYEGRERPKGLFVSCSGSPKADIFVPVIHVAKAFFAAMDYQYTGEVLLGHTDDPELAPRKARALTEAFEAGKMLVE